MMTPEIKPLTEKTLTVFCAIFDFARGEADITVPVSDSPTACLRALERRGLILWDTERTRGKTKRFAALTETGAIYGCESLALVPSVTSPARNRQWVRVQFDLNDDDYLAAWDIAGELAQARLLAPTIRDLLQIHESADKGDYSLFYQLYGIPETKETSQFATMIQTFADMQQTINALTAKLDRLQNAPRNAVNGANSSEPSVQREKVHDDGTDNVEMKITVDVNAGRRANELFLKAVFSLQDEPAESAQVTTNIDADLFVVSPAQPAPVGLRAGNVASVPMPVYEDDDEDLFA